jgi:Novel STAND NTPase 1
MSGIRSADRHLASIASPYPRLRPFKGSEEAIFFGRDRMIDDVIDRVANSRLVMVHGASGCGKSSLIRAGVLPRLERMRVLRDVRWNTVVMRPGRSPISHLARALVDALQPRHDDDDRLVNGVRGDLNRGLSGLADALELLRLPEGERLCILVDQFEELLRCANEGSYDEAAQFVRLLLAIRAGPGNVSIVVTMRSSYLGDGVHFQHLACGRSATQYLVVPMTHDELVDAICQPALQKAARFIVTWPRR